MTTPRHEMILHAAGLSKRFGARTVFEGVSFEIGKGESAGLMGPSGAGKSTLARCLAGLESVTSGRLHIDGSTQLIVQDPGASLNPRFTARQALAEPLFLGGRSVARVDELWRAAGLEDEPLDRRCAEFSTGQKARLAIARALAMEPRLLIFDESFSSLDSDTRERIAVLVKLLQQRHGFAILVVAHDLALIRRLTRRVLVLEGGQLRTVVATDPWISRIEALAGC